MRSQNTPIAKPLSKDSDIPASLVPDFLINPFPPTYTSPGAKAGRLIQNSQRLAALGLAVCGLSLGVFTLYAQASFSPQLNHRKLGVVARKMPVKAPVLPAGVTPVWLPSPNAPDPDADLGENVPDDQLINPPPSIAPIHSADISDSAPKDFETLAMLGAQAAPDHAGKALQSLKNKATQTTSLRSTEDEDEGELWQQVLTPGNRLRSSHSSIQHSYASSFKSVIRKKSIGSFSKNIGRGLRCFLIPVQRVLISSPFGPRHGRLHAGIDFAASVGDPIHVSAAGRVLYANWGGGYGRMVIVDHGNGLMTRYAHCSRLNVMPGQWVSKGQTIALVGDTGHSTGPHLHYEVLANGIPQNPSGYLIR